MKTPRVHVFRCSRCDLRYRLGEGGTDAGTRVVLTGKTRIKLRPPAWKEFGKLDRQYVCLDCGWKGWSAHKALEKAQCIPKPETKKG